MGRSKPPRPLKATEKIIIEAEKKNAVFDYDSDEDDEEALFGFCAFH